MQAMVEQLGGRVENSPMKEFGATEVTVNGDDALLHDLGVALPVWMSHGDKVVEATRRLQWYGQYPIGTTRRYG